MALTAGLTENGFIVPTFQEIRDDIETRFKELFGVSINTRSDAVFGIIIDIMSERELLHWEEQEAVYNSSHVTSSGVSLDYVCALTDVQRLLPQRSTSLATVTGVASTVLPIGRVFSVDSTGTLWRTLEEVTIPGGGSQSGVTVESVDYGPIVALMSDTFTIETPVTGWSSITMDEDATLGNLLETDSELRTRRETLLRALGSASLEAMAARVREVDGVVSVSVAENTTDAAAGGLDAHSFKVVVQGGDSVDICQTIFDNKPLGIATNGANSEVIVDSFGNSHTIYYDDPTDVPIYIDITGTKDASLYPSDGDTQIQNLLTAFGAALTIGEDVSYIQLFQQIVAAIPGLLTLTVELGLSEGTEAVQNISIDFDELASIDAGNIDITIT